MDELQAWNLATLVSARKPNMMYVPQKVYMS
jgi:hypothetical protein